MNTLQRFLAVLLLAFALAVTVQSVSSPFYQDAVNIGQIWTYVNYLMAFGVLASLVVHYQRKQAFVNTGETITPKYLEVNIAFYLSVVLALCFFWNWFDDLTVGPDGQDTVHLIMWTLVNPLFVVISGHAGFRLWRHD